jgi:drug/metabolite transporter (DMT)-like permease
MNWTTSAFIAMISFAMMILIFKKLTGTSMLPEVINFYFFLFSTVAFLIFNILKKTKLDLPINYMYLFILAALVAITANYFSIIAIKFAPNPGYAKAIQSFDVVVITVASIFLFGSEITFTKAIGVAFSIIGLILLSL